MEKARDEKGRFAKQREVTNEIEKLQKELDSLRSISDKMAEKALAVATFIESFDSRYTQYSWKDQRVSILTENVYIACDLLRFPNELVKCEAGLKCTCFQSNDKRMFWLFDERHTIRERQAFIDLVEKLNIECHFVALDHIDFSDLQSAFHRYYEEVYLPELRKNPAFHYDRNAKLKDLSID